MTPSLAGVAGPPVYGYSYFHSTPFTFFLELRCFAFTGPLALRC